METWWNRFVSKVRAHLSWGSPSISPNGTIALVTEAPAESPQAGERASPWTRVKERFSVSRMSTRAQLQEAVTRLTQLCETFQEHLARQEARMEEIATSMRKLSSDLATLPSATVEQKQQVERLYETVSAHRADTEKLSSMLADVPGTLQRNGDSIHAHGAALAGQGEALCRLVQHAGSVERTHVEIRDWVGRLGN